MGERRVENILNFTPKHIVSRIKHVTKQHATYTRVISRRSMLLVEGSLLFVEFSTSTPTGEISRFTIGFCRVTITLSFCSVVVSLPWRAEHKEELLTSSCAYTGRKEDIYIYVCVYIYMLCVVCVCVCWCEYLYICVCTVVWLHGC